MKLEAQRQAEAARELAERLRAQQVGASEHKPVILEGPIVNFVDGDTVTVRVGSHEYTIRLYGIDCPELDQPFGDKAAETLGYLVDADAVQVRLTDADQYGRLIGVVSLDGKSINLELVEAGLAWWYREYAPDDQQLAEAEAEARAVYRGLWVDPDAVPPWEWRRGKKPAPRTTPQNRF